jgi:hypothetical protein
VNGLALPGAQAGHPGDRLVEVLGDALRGHRLTGRPLDLCRQRPGGELT